MQAYYLKQSLHLGNVARLDRFDEIRSKVALVCLCCRRWLRIGQSLDHALDRCYGSRVLNP